MTPEEIRSLTENNEVIVSILVHLGFRETVAKVLVYLIRNPGSPKRAVERDTDLRGSQVSLATEYLSKRGWITHQKVREPGKGPHVTIYSPAKPVREILSDIEEEKRKTTQVLEENLKRLRESAREGRITPCFPPAMTRSFGAGSRTIGRSAHRCKWFRPDQTGGDGEMHVTGG